MYGRYTDNKRSNYTLEIRVRKRHIHNASVQSISPIELTKETTETMKIDFYIFFNIVIVQINRLMKFVLFFRSVILTYINDRTRFQVDAEERKKTMK